MKREYSSSPLVRDHSFPPEGSGNLPNVIGASESKSITVLKICTDGSTLYTNSSSAASSPDYYDPDHVDATAFSKVIPDNKAYLYKHLPNVRQVTDSDGQLRWRCYPDPDTMNYFVLPQNYTNLNTQIRLGDVGVLIDHNASPKQYVFCIVGETGPNNVFEEVSIGAAKRLGHTYVTPRISSNAGDFEFIAFINSRNNINWTYENLNQETIDTEGKKYFQ